MSNCSHCIPSSITWSPANDGTLNCTGTSASTVYTCYSNETIFFTDWDTLSPDIIFQYNPINGNVIPVTGVTINYYNGIANTTTKFWVQGSDNASIDEYTIAYSPLLPGNSVILTGPTNKPITGLQQLTSLVAISENVLVGSDGINGSCSMG
jgi:hypothetical protein